MRSKNKINFWLILLGIFMVLTLLNQASVDDGNIINNDDNDLGTTISLETSGFWTNFTYIHITDANWTIANETEWCKGDGSWGNPFIIENMTIDATGSPTGCGILIENSANYYFTIKNCTVTNWGTGSYDGGIKLLNSCNGTLLENNCSESGVTAGIILYGVSKNNTLLNNTVNGNQMGVFLRSADENFVINNTANRNTQYGIYIYIADFNLVENNTLNKNVNSGIRMYNAGDNDIINNIIRDNDDYGIEIDASNNVISNNKMKNNGVSMSGTLAELRTTIIHDNNTVNGRKIYFYIDENGLGANNFTNAGQILLVNCNDSIISDYNLSHCSTGIRAYSCHNNTITNNTVNNNRWGIYFTDASTNNTVFNNTVNNGFVGIRFGQNCINNTIANNTAYQNTFAGIEINDDSNNNTVRDNRVNNNEQGIYLLRSHNNLVLNNTVNENNQDGIWIFDSDNNEILNNTINDNNIAGGDLGGIHLDTNCDFTLIKGNVLRNTGGTTDQKGILLEINCNNNTIFNNTFDDQLRGVYLWDTCSNNTISNNNLFEDDGGTIFDYGIELNDDCERNRIIDNVIKNHGYLGVFLHVSSDYNYIARNKVWHDDGLLAKGNYGMAMNSCDNNTIIGNTFTNHSNYGIRIQNSCEDNNITENIISNNTYRGAEIDDNTCIGNIFWLNNFTNNGLHAFDDSDPGQNYWDNTSVGNYWDNYTGSDLNDNGIGDSVYTSIQGNAGNQDNYPIWDDGDIPPLITINLPLNNTIWNVAPIINISVYDPSFEHLWYNVSGQREFLVPGVEEQLRSDIWAGLPNGWFTIEIYANDTANNLNDTYTLRLYKDSIAPKITINLPINNTYWNTAPFINVTALDLNLNYTWYNVSNQRFFLTSGVEEQLDAGVWALLDDGPFIIEIYANDSYNQINNTYTLLLYKDTTAPEIIINDLDNYSYWNTAPFINITAIDPKLNYTWYNVSNQRFFLISGVAEQLDAGVWVLLNDGPFTIEIYANDSYNQINNTYTLLLYKDTEAPNITIILPILNNTIWGSPPQINITAEDSQSLAYMWYNVSGQREFLTSGKAEYLNDTIWASLGDGMYIIEFFANDSAGNINNTFTIVIYKDTRAPSLTILYPIDNQISPEVPLINVTATDLNLSKIWYICNGVKEFLTNNIEVGLLSAIWNNLDEGDFTITFYANDTFGYVNDTYVITLTKDTKPPVIEIEEFSVTDIVDIKFTSNASITWNIQDTTDILYIDIKIDDEDWIRLDADETTYSFEDLEMGEHKITIKAYDSAGHTGSVNYIFTIEEEVSDVIVNSLMLIVLIVGAVGIIAAILVFVKKTRPPREGEVPAKPS